MDKSARVFAYSQPTADSSTQPFAKGDYSADVELFTKHIEMDRANVMAFINRGHAYYLNDDFDHAIRDYSTALSLDPDNTLAYELRGDIYYIDLGKMQLAIADYTQVLKRLPDRSSTLEVRGKAYLANGDYDLAVADLERALNIDPKNSRLNEALGRARARTETA